MYAVTLLKNSKLVKLIGFVNSKEEFDKVVDEFISRYGADWLGENGYDFRVELAF